MKNRSGSKIDNLGEKNFHIWKQKVEILELRELDDIITGKTPNNGDELVKWNKQDANDNEVIGNKLGDENLDQVFELCSTYEIWKEVINVFKRRILLKIRRNSYSVK